MQKLGSKIQIGKNGITDNVIMQIRRYVKKHNVVKVKMLKSFMETHDKKDTAKKIAKKTNTRLAGMTGFTITLGKIPEKNKLSDNFDD